MTVLEKKIKIERHWGGRVSLKRTLSIRSSKMHPRCEGKRSSSETIIVIGKVSPENPYSQYEEKR